MAGPDVRCDVKPEFVNQSKASICDRQDADDGVA